jgi:hypothetical protein
VQGTRANFDVGLGDRAFLIVMELAEHFGQFERRGSTCAKQNASCLLVQRLVPRWIHLDAASVRPLRGRTLRDGLMPASHLR